jgi:hypothetical protein
MVGRQRKVQGYYGSWLPFLLELSAAAGDSPLGFHRRELSLGDGMFADLRGSVAAAGEIC